MALLHIEKNNGIATVSLNRPDKRNAMSFCFTPRTGKRRTTD